MATLATVIPLQTKEKWKLYDATVATPEPAALFHLIVLALLLHGPSDLDSERCRQCRKAWPCPQVSLACRLLDGL